MYYWYNFMPLARGSAAVGFTTILSLFWAFGFPVSVRIPKNYQTDWEAILCKVRHGSQRFVHVFHSSVAEKEGPEGALCMLKVAVLLRHRPAASALYRALPSW